MESNWLIVTLQVLLIEKAHLMPTHKHSRVQQWTTISNKLSNYFTPTHHPHYLTMKPHLVFNSR